MNQKQKIIRIINEEINQFQRELQRYIKAGLMKDAKIASKALKRLEVMIKRIQDEA
tara:strand:- start:20447 stop:20614 length:168 start_codon:yes stop_codon:yes gene_type:complete